jgi:hypothetical protein
VWPRPFTADQTELMTAKGCSEGSGLEPRISRRAQMIASPA